MKKNNIKAVRENEIKVANEEAAKAARQAELDAIVEKDAFTTIPEVREGEAASVADENDNLLGIEGGKYHTTLVGDKVISAESKEELEAIKTRMENGIEGDGMLHKTVTILGMKCDIQGRNEEELAADYKKAEEFAYAHRGHMFRDVTEAEALHESEYTENDGEQLTVRDRVVLLLANENRIIAVNTHETLVSLDDLGTDLVINKEAAKKILVDRLEKKFIEEDLAAAKAEDDDDDYDDDDYDDDDYDDDDDEDWDDEEDEY